MRNILLTCAIGSGLIFSACKKSDDGGGTNGPVIHGTVSGIIKKVSFSSATLKASVSLYERDALGRLVSITFSNEDSTSGVVSTITQKTGLLYEGTDDKPKSYWILVKNAALQYDTLYRVYNEYNVSNKLISDSSIWIAYYNRELSVIQKFSYSGNWIVSDRKDVQKNMAILHLVDSLNLTAGNLVYDGFYDYGSTASVQNQQIIQMQFDDKVNPLGKLNIAKYIFDRYQFAVYSQNNPLMETINEPSSSTKYRFVYEYSENNYPVVVYQYSSMNGGPEVLFRTIKYVYE